MNTRKTALKNLLVTKYVENDEFEETYMNQFNPRAQQSHFRKMVFTKYQSEEYDDDEDRIEEARAGASILSTPQDDTEIVVAEGENVILTDDPSYQTIHGIDDTPKLTVKRAPIARDTKDEAIKVLRKMQAADPSDFLTQNYHFFTQRWFYTTRDSEMQLAEYVLLTPNHRPNVFTMQCRHLEVEDVGRLILTSMLTEPRETGQVISRFAIKPTTEMPFADLLKMAEQLSKEHDGFQITDGVVTASLMERGRGLTHRLKTNEIKQYAHYEPILDEENKIFSARACFTVTVKGKRHVTTQVSYCSNAKKTDNDPRRSEMYSRMRYVELEQTVKCMNRRVVIDESSNKMYDFEVEDEMTPIRMGVPPVTDLIDYIKLGEAALEDM